MMRPRHLVALLGAAALVVGVGAAEARPTDHVTLSMSWASSDVNALPPLIANFERVYPNVTVSVTYSCLVGGVENVELSAGNGPDLICDFPGCGQSPAMCELADAGDLAPLVHEPWVKRSLRIVTSLSKLNGALYGLEKGVSPYGVYTNDALFAKLGLNVPQTFSQLLSLCQKAKADGTYAYLLAGGSGGQISMLVSALAVSTVYAVDPHWTAELKAGTTTFDGTPGWHQAMQELISMNQAGCFEPGTTGVGSSAAATALFAEGQGLMLGEPSSFGAELPAAQPPFAYTFHPFPGGTAPDSTTTFLNLSPMISINVRSSPQNQAAAREFIDFMGRPKQAALFEQLSNGFTQYEFLKGQIPSDMVGFGLILANRRYVINPSQTWWNPDVNTVYGQDAAGLLTGQVSIDQILTAMDAAWKQGRD